MCIEAEEELKKIVIIKSGLTELTPKDCKLLSEQIFAENKNYISENSIKSIFGFIKKPVVAKTFIYNSLAQFVGYESYQKFRKNFGFMFD